MINARLRPKAMAFALLAWGALLSHGCQCQKDKGPEKASAESAASADADGSPADPCALAKQPENAKTTELKTVTVKEGTGEAAKAGDKVVVHYTGILTDCTKFDSSRDRGEPFDFTLGAEQVIKGWDKGVAGMKVGERRHLVVPAEMGYGAAGAGNVIPPNAVLVFDVELLEIQKGK